MAARGCFAKQGFAGTSIKDIQDASGFSRGNLYHHFKTKEKIVHIFIAQNLGRFRDRVDQIIAESNQANLSFYDAIENLVAFAEEITKGPGKGMAFHVWSLAKVDDQTRQTMQSHFERIRQELKNEIIILQKKISYPTSKTPKHSLQPYLV